MTASLREYLDRIKRCFESGDASALGQTMEAAAAEANGDVLVQRLKEETEIHLENLKQEAVRRFDRERYEECRRIFQFLCAVEPDRKIWWDYLELCQQASEGKSTLEPCSALVQFAPADVLPSLAHEPDEKRPASPVMTRDRNEKKPGNSLQAAGAAHRHLYPAVTGRHARPSGSQGRIASRKRTIVLSVLAATLLVGTSIDLWVGRRPAEEQTPPDVRSAQSEARPPVGIEPVSSHRARSRTPLSQAPKSSSRPGTRRSVLSADKPGEVKRFAVVHAHRFGSCRGDLAISRDSLAFVPSHDSKHGFTVHPRLAATMLGGGDLQIRLAGKTYRFRSATETHEQRRQKNTTSIYEHVKAATARSL